MRCCWWWFWFLFCGAVDGRRSPSALEHVMDKVAFFRRGLRFVACGEEVLLLLLLLCLCVFWRGGCCMVSRWVGDDALEHRSSTHSLHSDGYGALEHRSSTHSLRSGGYIHLCFIRFCHVPCLQQRRPQGGDRSCACYDTTVVRHTCIIQIHAVVTFGDHCFGRYIGMIFTTRAPPPPPSDHPVCVLSLFFFLSASSLSLDRRAPSQVRLHTGLPQHPHHRAFRETDIRASVTNRPTERPTDPQTDRRA